MEKRCIFFTTLATVAILTAVILVSIIYTTSEDVCTTRRCVQIASELMTSLDQSVEPCDDFYNFACGSMRRLLAQGEKTSAYDAGRGGRSGGGGDGSGETGPKQNAIRDMIEEAPTPFDTKTLSQIKTFYHSCTRRTTDNETVAGGGSGGGGVTADGIRAVCNDIGGWPMLDRGNWREDLFDWIIAVRHLARHGILENIFIRTDIETNQYNITRNILSIRITRDYLDGARINTGSDRTFFVEYLVEVASYFGVDRTRAERDSYEIVAFLDQLKKIHRGNDTQTVNGFNYQSIYQLQHNVPYISWIFYINGFLEPNLKLTEDEFVNVPSVDKIRRLLNLLNSTPKKILANYICWRVIQANIPYFPEDFKERIWKYNRILPYLSRRNACLTLIQDKMGEAVETCYVHRYVTDDVKRTAKTVIEAIQTQLIETADKLDWLDDDGRRVAIEKLRSLRYYVGHAPPDEPPSWPDVYHRLDFIDDQFVMNLRALQLANANINYAKLRLPASAHNYLEVEYSLIGNYLVLPSAYLQAFYVDESRPMYMNFALLGSLVGHQLAEVFLEGRRYDSRGELREWSTSQSLFNYDNKTRCLTKQYEQFPLPEPGPNVNASLTQLDDVAVLFGKLIAYKAYVTWVDAHTTEGRLPGMQYSTKQLNWIASAMNECLEAPSASSATTLMSPTQSPRSISKLRVVGPLRNSEDFAKDFRCPIDSYMNPADKCTLW